MADPDPHQMMTCPYNMAHQVEHYRLQFHLEKCRKQYPNCKKVSCPFDATHIVNDAEQNYHVTVCPKRHMLDSQMYVVSDDYRPMEPPPPPQIASTVEDWDLGRTSSGGYVPDLSQKCHIIKKPRKGVTPSERAKDRMESIKAYKPLD